MRRRRPHRVPREVLDFFEDGDRGVWSIREHRRRSTAVECVKALFTAAGVFVLCMFIFTIWAHS